MSRRAFIEMVGVAGSARDGGGCVWKSDSYNAVRKYSKDDDRSKFSTSTTRWISTGVDDDDKEGVGLSRALILSLLCDSG